MKLNVYIPKILLTMNDFGFPAGTALVEHPEKSNIDSVLCYIEGNLYGAKNLETFRDKVICAAGRLVESYPTSAIRFMQRDDLVFVGYLDYETKDLHFVEDENILNEFREWSGETPVDPRFVQDHRLIKVGLDGTKPMPMTVFASVADLERQFRVGELVYLGNQPRTVTHFSIAV